MYGAAALFYCHTTSMVLIHILILLFTGLTIMLADKQAFAWMRGSTPLLDAKKVAASHRNVSIGLGFMIVTGITMFLGESEEFLENPAFFVKMAFVLVLVVNGFVIGKISSIATTREYASLTKSEKLPLFISGAVSTIGWLGAIAMGLSLD